MENHTLDFTLVPVGLFLVVAYHIWLLYRIVNHPSATFIGFQAMNRRLWVSTMIEGSKDNGKLAVDTLRNNMTSSTILASVAIAMSSLIVGLITNRGFMSSDNTEQALQFKFCCILSFYLLAFLLNLISLHYYNEASIVINVLLTNQQGQRHHLTFEDVCWVVNMGAYFWALGLRAFFFSFPLILWVVGPILAFLSCVALSLILYFLDSTFPHAHGVSSVLEDLQHEHVQNDDVNNESSEGDSNETSVQVEED